VDGLNSSVAMLAGEL